MKKIAIINAITGSMDMPKVVPQQTMPAEFYTFNDRNVPQGVKCFNKRTQALYFKYQMHHIEAVKDADIFIWIDGKIQVDSSTFVEQCYEALRGYDLAILKHGERSCIYDEHGYILGNLGKGNPYFVERFAHRRDTLLGQDALALKWGYPENYGLNDCSIMVHRNNDHTNLLFDLCWQVCAHSEWFDQTAIHMLAYRQRFSIKSIEFNQGTYHTVKHLKIR